MGDGLPDHRPLTCPLVTVTGVWALVGLLLLVFLSRHPADTPCWWRVGGVRICGPSSGR